MAVIPKVEFKNAGNCKSLFAVDETGIYDPNINLGGFGTPNQDVTDFTSATLDIVRPDGTVVTTIIVNPPLPNLNNASFELTNIMLGYGASQVISDGVYQTKYTLIGTPNAVSSNDLLVTCNADCCFKNIVALTKAKGCKKKDKERFSDALVEYVLLKQSACCGKSNEALTHLTNFQAICNQLGCGCGCSS